MNNFSISPGIPKWAPPLPAKLDIGKRVRVIKGSWTGWEGVVKTHYICADDCSGMFGQHKYGIEKENGERFSSLVSDCELCHVE